MLKVHIVSVLSQVSSSWQISFKTVHLLSMQLQKNRGKKDGPYARPTASQPSAAAGTESYQIHGNFSRDPPLGVRGSTPKRLTRTTYYSQYNRNSFYSLLSLIKNRRAYGWSTHTYYRYHPHNNPFWKRGAAEGGYFFTTTSRTRWRPPAVSILALNSCCWENGPSVFCARIESHLVVLLLLEIGREIMADDGRTDF